VSPRARGPAVDVCAFDSFLSSCGSAEADGATLTLADFDNAEGAALTFALTLRLTLRLKLVFHEMALLRVLVRVFQCLEGTSTRPLKKTEEEER